MLFLSFSRKATWKNAQELLLTPPTVDPKLELVANFTPIVRSYVLFFCLTEFVKIEEKIHTSNIGIYQCVFFTTRLSWEMKRLCTQNFRQFWGFWAELSLFFGRKSWRISRSTYCSNYWRNEAKIENFLVYRLNFWSTLDGSTQTFAKLVFGAIIPVDAKTLPVLTTSCTALKLRWSFAQNRIFKFRTNLLNNGTLKETFTPMRHLTCWMVRLEKHLVHSYDSGSRCP